MKKLNYKIDGRQCYEIEPGDITAQLRSVPDNSFIIWDENILEIKRRKSISYSDSELKNIN